MVLKESKKRSMMDFIALESSKQDDLSKKIKKMKKKKSKADVFASNSPGVVFLKHIPNGFYEPQMRKYFSQFGRVVRLRLSRSKKTGKSKSYAYIEFQCKEVADVVAETMNNYLMFERCLKCEVVPPDKLHPETFKGADKKFRKPTSRKDAIRRLNEVDNDPKQVAKRNTKIMNKRAKIMQRLKEVGIELDLTKLGTNPTWKPPPRKLPDPNMPELPKKGEKSEIRKTFEEMIAAYDYDCYKKKGRKQDAKGSNVKDGDSVIISSSNVSALGDIDPQGEEVSDEYHCDSGNESEMDEAESSNGESAAFVDAREDNDSSTNVTSEILVDSEDDEITFKTPPMLSKVKKRRLSAAAEAVSPEETLSESTPKMRRRNSICTKTNKRMRDLVLKRKLLNMTM